MIKYLKTQCLEWNKITNSKLLYIYNEILSENHLKNDKRIFNQKVEKEGNGIIKYLINPNEGKKE